MKKLKSQSANRKKAENKKLVALTLKIDSKTYVRLSTFRAQTRQTAQEILSEALNEYLDRAGA